MSGEEAGDGFLHIIFHCHRSFEGRCRLELCWLIRDVGQVLTSHDF